LLTAKAGLITIDTPTAKLAPSDGPAVKEGMGGHYRYRKTTVYNTKTWDVTVKSGDLVTNGQGWQIADRTVEQDAFSLPEEILLVRLATATRTLKAAAAIFLQIAQKNPDGVTWSVTKNPPR
jgi:hypothetical protein